MIPSCKASQRRRETALSRLGGVSGDGLSGSEAGCRSCRKVGRSGGEVVKRENSWRWSMEMIDYQDDSGVWNRVN